MAEMQPVCEERTDGQTGEIRTSGHPGRDGGAGGRARPSPPLAARPSVEEAEAASRFGTGRFAKKGPIVGGGWPGRSAARARRSPSGAGGRRADLAAPGRGLLGRGTGAGRGRFPVGSPGGRRGGPAGPDGWLADGSRAGPGPWRLPRRMEAAGPPRPQAAGPGGGPRKAGCIHSEPDSGRVASALRKAAVLGAGPRQAPRPHRPKGAADKAASCTARMRPGIGARVPLAPGRAGQR